MRSFVLAAVLFFAVGCSLTASAAMLEAAKSCDDAKKALAELVKNPDTKEAALIADALGVDILASCDFPEGKIICFQCLDRSGELRSVQLLQKQATRKFELLGFGCRCREKQ